MNRSQFSILANSAPALALIAAFSAAPAAHAQAVVTTSTSGGVTLTTYSGHDDDYGPDGNPRAVRTYADDAAALFATATAHSITNNFTFTTTGSFASVTSPGTAKPSVTITATNNSTNRHPAADTVWIDGRGDESHITGFGTTGTNTDFLHVSNTGNAAHPDTVTFTFAPNISGFGAYFTGVGTSTGTVLLNFNDGTSATEDISALIGNPAGGIGYLGFTENGKSLSSLTLTDNGADELGVDDITVVQATPEPGMVVTGLSMLSMTGLGLLRGRRRMSSKGTVAAA